MVNNSLLSRIGEAITKFGGGHSATDMIQKLNTMIGLSHTGNYGGLNKPAPPYQRHFSPLWIYKIRRDSALVNNAINKKRDQVFKHGFSEWEKEYDAKCPRCEHEFDGFDAFREQMEVEDHEQPDPGPQPMADGGMGMMEDMGPPEPPGGGEMGGDLGGLPAGGSDAEVDLDEDDFDFDSERVCPECEEVVEMMEPEPDVKKKAQKFFDRCNSQGPQIASVLEPQEQSSVSQSLLEVFEELAQDLESFDDAWLIFDRSYYLDEDGHILSYELEEVFRAPPELMRYSVDEETNDPGGEYWVCPRCRAENEEYYPEEEEQPCEDCGGATYEAFAYAMETPDGKEDEFFIRGEFAHDSLYEKGRYYGYPPVLSLWEEARTLEQMDAWYHDAYEERRAPRGAITVNAARDEELRTMNYQQMEKLREDPNYIPLFMNDQETEGEPIKFVELLSDPAEMQHMEMREWFEERIQAKWGVTSILMSGSPENSGLSQSMEVEVSQKAAENLRDVFHDTFLPAVLAQLGTEGWTREIEPAVDEDESEEAQLVGQHLNNAQKALQMGAEVEWTEEDRATIKQGELEAPEEGMEGGMMGGGMDMMGMEGGIGDDRGPDPHSLEPGEDHTVDEPGERAEGPDDPDRPAAQPLERMMEPRDGKLEKIAASGFNLPEESESERLAKDLEEILAE